MFGTQGGGPELFPFADLGDVFDVFFGGGFGRGRGRARQRTRTQRGGDLYATVALTFEEASFGVEKEVHLESLETCSRCKGNGCEPGTYPSRCTRCGGSGEVQDVQRSIFGTVMTARTCTTCEGTGEEIATRCTQCDGDGRVTRDQVMSVEVPAGVTDGLELRISGGGDTGREGGTAGDLYVALQVAPHPVFERRGQDLFAVLPVPMTRAALGAEVEVETLDGAERVRLEPGTDSGTTIRLKGRGVPNLGRRGRGDLFLQVVVETPRRLDREQRKLLARLAELRAEETPSGGSLRGELRRPGPRSA
jgi:molecular chaperone DnaJ